MKAQFQEAFTIIEVLIAIFILTVGIIAVLHLFPLGANLQNASQMASISSQLGQAKMEEIISLSYNEISPGTFQESYGFNPAFPYHKRETVISFFDPDNPGIPPAEDLGIKKIEVTVFWDSPFSLVEKEVKIATLIAKR
jgi:type II secretory pathway pseudopilin PulG